LHRRIVQVAYLKAIETDAPVWSWLEHTIDRFRTATSTTTGSFAAIASYARATALFGEVGDQPLRDRLNMLDKHRTDFSASILAEISRVDRARATTARRRSGAGNGRGRRPHAYPVLASVEKLIEMERIGDLKVAEELDLIREALGLNRSI
jgi:hypothetical protein